MGNTSLAQQPQRRLGQRQILAAINPLDLCIAGGTALAPAQKPQGLPCFCIYRPIIVSSVLADPLWPRRPKMLLSCSPGAAVSSRDWSERSGWLPMSEAKVLSPRDQQAARLTPHSTRGPDLPGTVSLFPALHGPPLASILLPQTNNYREG